MGECVIEVAIRGESVADVVEQLQGLLGSFGVVQTIVPGAGPIVEGTATEAAADPAPPSPGDEPRKRRSRKTEEPAAAAAAAAPAAEPAAEAATEAASEEAAAADSDPRTADPATGGVSFEQLRALLTQVQAKRKLAGVIELLAEHAQCRKLSEVAPENYAAVAEAARAILAAA